ncbi:unnamed protein product [Leptosia nina]|uniref:Methyltransferase type 11 domain-containing protein n=1 Tax=Leptosia nina TaxID=320188 RepID=A0AAV1IUN6_9NEOP
MVMGCDINKDMVDFAKANYSSEDINFIVLDIAGEVPGSLRGKFDHAFSFFVLHWVKNQEIAFKNIYDLLGNDGDCLLIVVGQAALYDGFRDLAQSKKWRGLLEENEKYVSPYHDGEDSVSELKEMLLKIGFSTVDINEKPVAFSHDNEDSFRGSLRALIPFNIPEEQFDDFLDDLAYAMQEGDHKKYNLEKSSSDLTFNFNNIAIYIKK